MAKTLLSGANIVYNGNPLNDLSLTAFLDKFMEKKPKSSTWHGGSQIEPAKKLDMDKHLIGPEILSLAEVDVPPEDLVFHKFYMNKMNTSKKPKKKKKRGAEDEAAEDLLGEDGGDESDNEEIENMLDSSHLTIEADGDYDYDDLDQVADEDDEDLAGYVSDAEVDMPSDATEEVFDDTANEIDSDNDDNVSDIGDGGDDIIEIGDADYDSNEEDASFDQRKGKRKAGLSPFASFEDYEHLLNDDISTEDEPSRKKPKKPKSRKKRKASD